MELRKKPERKFRTSTGFEPVTSRCNNYAMKSLMLEASQLCVHVPVKEMNVAK